MLKNYKDLKVWQKSYSLCLHIYRISRKFPKEERYGLASQIRKICLSGDLNYVDQEKLKVLKDNISGVERMLKALIKSLENKRLNP